MISLQKGALPQILADNAAAWTATLTQKLSNGEKPTNAEKTRYRHSQIKTSLVTETKGKCAYCESKLLHIHHGDVEHIYPKSLDPAKSFEWDNLTLACEICNQNKADNDPLVESIIDPYNTNPANHLVFAGPFLFDLGTAHGISTRVTLKLDRPELTERRKEQLEKIMGVYQTVLRTDIPIAARKAIYQNLVAKEGSQEAPYTAMARQLIHQMEHYLPADIKN